MQPKDPADDKVRCPKCQTLRLRVLSKIDRIETLHGNKLLNRIRQKRGYTLYHCIYCRLQFYDARKPAPSSPAQSEAGNGQPETSAPAANGA